MKKIWTYILAVLGFSSNAHADCYNMAVEAFNEDDIDIAINYCVEADLREMEVMRKTYNDASLQEKYVMSLRAEFMADRLEQMGFGDIVIAVSVCDICQGGGNQH